MVWLPASREGVAVREGTPDDIVEVVVGALEGAGLQTIVVESSWGRGLRLDPWLGRGAFAGFRWDAVGLDRRTKY